MNQSPRDHIIALAVQLAALDLETARFSAWGAAFADSLLRGARLLAAGEGPSAGQAELLALEIRSRQPADRGPLGALVLRDDQAAPAPPGLEQADDAIARSVRMHARPGDIFIAISTTGHEPGMIAAVEAAKRLRLRTWALTGPGPNALLDLCDESFAVDARVPATIKEVHTIVIELLCGALDAALTGGAVQQQPAAAAPEPAAEPATPSA